MDERAISIHDRGEGQTALVYPVVSRRSEGLSLGINLFPDRKRCNFDCPYCEVRPFQGDRSFSPRALEDRLERFFLLDYPRDWSPMPVRDLCFSGNGEPTLSSELWEALEICAASRRRHKAILGSSPIVIITNATGFLDGDIARRLADFARREPLKIWAKLDAGDQEGFSRMSRSGFGIDEIVDAMGKFSRETPILVQTMICGLRERTPGIGEALLYAAKVNSMVALGANIEAIHLYTLARRPLEPWVSPLSMDAILGFMRIVSDALIHPLPMLGFGEGGERLSLPA